MLSYGTPEEKIVEMAWWEERELLGLRIAATPAQHWSGRNPWDSNRSLWCGFVVKSLQNERMSFFHAGDTGYSEGAHSDGFLHSDVSLIPCDALIQNSIRPSGGCTRPSRSASYPSAPTIPDG